MGEDEDFVENDRSNGADASDVDAPGLEVLLDYLNRSRGFDFTGYKRAGLARRIRRRMQLVSVKSYADYVDHLKSRPDELPRLFNMILINVTGFFRDAAAWEAIRQVLVRKLGELEGRGPLRIWCAGCASGEEAFTLAMIVAELVGVERYAESVKIYATDVDEEALAFARLATYPPRAVEGVPPELLEKYFAQVGGSFVFSKELRRGVIFARHDLMQDAPISRIDMITCRNTLMYFNAETQTRILNRLHFGLNDDGVFFVGKAEMLLTHANLFTPTDLKLRIFIRAKGRARERTVFSDVAGLDGAVTEDRSRLYRAAFERGPTAQIVLDAEGRVALFNHRAAQLFSLVSGDISRSFHDLELSYRPAELRSFLDRVRKERRPLHIRDVERALPSGTTYLDIEIVPLMNETGTMLGTQINFADITDAHLLQADLRKTNVELETAHEELQSASEELETTNEELQSTNEELETMNEELQSTNEELQVMNKELGQRSEDVADLSGFYSAILATLRPGIAVLDRALMVNAWNPQMEDLWGLRFDEVKGKHFLTLDIGLPTDQLAGAIRTSVAAGERGEVTLDCANHRGRPVRCRVTVTPLKGEPSRGLTVVVEEAAS